MRDEHGKGMNLDEFKAVLRDQYFMLLLDERRALETIPVLLKGHEKSGPKLVEKIHRVVTAAGALDEEGQRRFEEISVLFDASVARLPAQEEPRLAS